MKMPRSKTGTRVLREPAHSKCTWTSQRGAFLREFAAKKTGGQRAYSDLTPGARQYGHIVWGCLGKHRQVALNLAFLHDDMWVSHCKLSIDHDASPRRSMKRCMWKRLFLLWRTSLTIKGSKNIQKCRTPNTILTREVSKAQSKPYNFPQDRGAVVTWGDPACGGDSSSVQAALTQGVPLLQQVQTKRGLTWLDVMTCKLQGDIKAFAQHSRP